MSNALARVAAPAPKRDLAENLANALSPALHGAIYRLENGGLPANMDIEPIRGEALARLQDVERLLQPAGLDRVKTWLLLVNGLVASLPEDAFEQRFAALGDILAEMPAAVLTRQTAADVAKSQKFFPVLAEIEAALSPRVRELKRLHRSLGEIAGTKGDAQPRPASAEVVASIAAGFRGLVAERTEAAARAENATIRDGHEKRPKAIPLSPRARLEAYREAALRETDPNQKTLLQQRADALAAVLDETTVSS